MKTRFQITLENLAPILFILGLCNLGHYVIVVFIPDRFSDTPVLPVSTVLLGIWTFPRVAHAYL